MRGYFALTDDKLPFEVFSEALSAAVDILGEKPGARVDPSKAKLRMSLGGSFSFKKPASFPRPKSRARDAARV